MYSIHLSCSSVSVRPADTVATAALTRSSAVSSGEVSVAARFTMEMMSTSALWWVALNAFCRFGSVKCSGAWLSASRSSLSGSAPQSDGPGQQDADRARSRRRARRRTARRA